MSIAMAVGVMPALAVLLTATPASAVAAPVHISTTLEGCKGSVGSFPANGPFICDDAEYTTGNLGPGWNELDFVPHRLTTTSGNQDTTTTSYRLAVAADYMLNNDGILGYDYMSEAVVNDPKSDDSCTVNASPIQHAALGGTYDTMFRYLDIVQAKNTTCVFDWYQELGLGSHSNSGSALHSNVALEAPSPALITTKGIGASDVSIPIKPIVPPSVRKEMTASRDATQVWKVEKSVVTSPTTVTDTCVSTLASRQTVAEVKVKWYKDTVTPSGDIDTTTSVWVTNAAHRPLQATMTDRIYAGLTAGTGTYVAGPSVVTAVPVAAAGLSPTETNLVTDAPATVHPSDFAAGTDLSSLSDRAFVVLSDPPGVPVVHSWTVTGDDTATVQTGTTANSAIDVVDVEKLVSDSTDPTSAAPAGVTFAASINSPVVGAFDGYTSGTDTAGPVTWKVLNRTTDGQVIFHKVITFAQGYQTTGYIYDRADVYPTGTTSSIANAHLNVSVTSGVKTTIDVSKTTTLKIASAQTFTFHLYNAPLVTGTDTGTSSWVTIPALGNGPVKTSDALQGGAFTGLSPTGSYWIKEDATAPYPTQSSGLVTFSLNTAGLVNACSATVSLTNSQDAPQARVQKITDPVNPSTNWKFTLTGKDASGTNFSEDLTAVASGAGYSTFTHRLLYDGGTYVITETPQTPDFDLTVIAGDFGDGTVAGSDATRVTKTLGTNSCSFTVNLTTDFSPKFFECTFTNTKRGVVTVSKTVSDAAGGNTVPGAGFTFDVRTGASTGHAGTVIATTTTAASGNAEQWTVLPSTTVSTLKLAPGTYQLCETGIQVGWHSTIEDLAGAFMPNTLDNSTWCVQFILAAGGTQAFTIDNRMPPGGDARTIGYWKNWSSCGRSNGKQEPVLDETLALFAIASGQTTHGVLIGDLYVDTCTEAVRLLDKSDVVTGDKRAGDAAYGLAAQLLAAQLNYQAGAEQCTAATNAINSAQTLLSSAPVNFLGTGSYLTSKSGNPALRNQANGLAGTLDSYNNNTLCP